MVDNERKIGTPALSRLANCRVNTVTSRLPGRCMKCQRTEAADVPEACSSIETGLYPMALSRAMTAGRESSLRVPVTTLPGPSFALYR